MLFIGHNYYPNEDPIRGEAAVFVTQEYFGGLDAACQHFLGKTMLQYAADDPRAFFDQFYTGVRAYLPSERYMAHIQDEQTGAAITIDTEEVGEIGRAFNDGDLIDPDRIQVDFAMRILPPDTPSSADMARLSPQDHLRVVSAAHTIIAFTLNPPGAN
jgi:hypothetical protein